MHHFLQEGPHNLLHPKLCNIVIMPSSASVKDKIQMKSIHLMIRVHLNDLFFLCDIFFFWGGGLFLHYFCTYEEMKSCSGIQQIWHYYFSMILIFYICPRNFHNLHPESCYNTWLNLQHSCVLTLCVYVHILGSMAGVNLFSRLMSTYH